MSKMNKKKNRGWLLILLLLILVTAVLYLIFSGWLNQWIGKPSNNVLDKTEIYILRDRDASETECMNGLVISAGKTGVRAYDAKGQICWDIAYTMQQPRLFTCEGYALVADYGATQAVLIREDGENVAISADAPILFARVDEGGRVLLASTDTKRNSLSLYDAQGTLLLRRVTYQNKDGIPIAAAVSADGKRLAGAYVSYTGGAICTNMTVFDLSDNGADLTDRILGNYRLDEQLVSDLYFRGHDLFFVGDACFGVLDAARDCTPAWRVEPSYEITFAAVTNDTLAIGYGDPKAGTATPASEYFFLYDKSGKVLYHGLSEAPTSLSAAAGVFVVGDGHAFHGISARGRILWEKDFTVEYRRLLPLADQNTVVAVGPERLEYYYVRNKWEVEQK